MPELPEVETIRRGLQKAIVGKKIRGVEVRKPKIFQGKPKEVVGATIKKIERRGKVLIIRLSGNKNLMIHFKLTGQMVWVRESKRAGERESEKITLGHPIPFVGAELPAKTTHVIFTIDEGKLFYNDLRQFGWIRLVDSRQVSAISNQLGIEPFTKEFTPGRLGQIFAKTKRPIKLVLMDQGKIAGVGNIYANDALFEAGIMPTRPANTLNQGMVIKLHRAIEKVLANGLKYGGSSARDEAYIKPTGEPGSYQEHFRVYQKENQPCPKCGKTIKRIKFGGRGTFYCPKCQK